MNINERIIAKTKELGISQVELAKRTGLTKGAVNQWFKGISAPNGENLLKTSIALGVTPEWLQFGKESMARVVDTSIPAEALPMTARRLAPVISYIQAGHWVELVDAYPMGSGFEQIEIDAKWSPHSFVLKVRGDSMSPTLTEGAYIVIDPAVEHKHGSIVVVRQNGDTEVTVKRLQKDGDSWYLKADNAAYGVIKLLPDAHVCGVVVEMMVKFV
jgi:SOS-response transcriptional repressor LexA